MTFQEWWQRETENRPGGGFDDRKDAAACAWSVAQSQMEDFWHYAMFEDVFNDSCGNCKECTELAYRCKAHDSWWRLLGDYRKKLLQGQKR